eukprot:2060337-Rhodomonas_salina.1
MPDTKTACETLGMAAAPAPNTRLPWSQNSGMTLAPVHKNVWVAERPFKFLGLADCGSKMT